jgi:hypothetical protein
MTSDRQKIASDGLSTDYYKLPETRKLHEIIEYKNMTPGIGMVFRMCIDLHLYDRKTIDKKLDEMKNLIDNYKIIQTIDIPNDIELPEHAIELRHVISYYSMSSARSNIFKALYRLNQKENVDEQYDINKILFFIQDLKEINERGEHI